MRKGLQSRIYSIWDSSQGWIAAALIGIFTAVVAFLVDIVEATISDYKVGVCRSNLLRNRETCCTEISGGGAHCPAWTTWSGNYWAGFLIYIGMALLFGVAAGAVTMVT